MALPRLQLFNYDELRDADFEPYQAEGIERLCNQPRLLFMDETGLGKTVQILGLLAALADDGQLPTTYKGRVLIAMPAALLGQWQEVFRRFVPDLSFQVVTSATLNRRPKRPPSQYPQVELVSYDTLKSLRYIEGFKSKAYSVVVLEKAAELKASEGKRFEALMEIASQAKRIYVVTATGLENHPLELWALLRLMQVPGVPPSLKIWGDTYVHWEPGYEFRRGGSIVTVAPKPVGLLPERAGELRDIIAPYLLRRTAKEVGLKMPRVIPRVVLVKLGQAQRDAYAAGANERNAGARHAAMEIACEQVGHESAKVDWLVPWVANRPGKKVVVMAEHVELLKLAQSRLEDAGIGCLLLRSDVQPKARGGVVDAFRDDDRIQVLLGSGVLQRGVDGLQTITDTLVIIGSPYNPAAVEQTIGRLKRFGSLFDQIDVVMVIADTEHERKKLATLDAKSAVTALVFGGSSTDYRGLIDRAQLLDDFVELNEGWTVEDVAHLAASASSPAELEAELIRLVTQGRSSSVS